MIEANSNFDTTKMYTQEHYLVSECQCANSGVWTKVLKLDYTWQMNGQNITFAVTFKIN